MRLAIFGATGTVGRELLTQSLDAGHNVRALVRTPSKISAPHPRLSVVHGDVRDLAAVKRTVDGCDAVLSTLGATDKDDSDLRRVGIENVLAAMHEHDIRRIVAMGGFHLPFPGDPDNIGRKLIVPIIRLMGIVIEDTTAMAALIRASDLDWTVVRAPRVARQGRPVPVRTGTLKLGPWSKVTRANVSSFMLRCLTDESSIGRAPMISDRRRGFRAAYAHAARPVRPA